MILPAGVEPPDSVDGVGSVVTGVGVLSGPISLVLTGVGAVGVGTAAFVSCLSAAPVLTIVSSVIT